MHNISKDIYHPKIIEFYEKLAALMEEYKVEFEGEESSYFYTSYCSGISIYTNNIYDNENNIVLPFTNVTFSKYITAADIKKFVNELKEKKCLKTNTI